MKRYCSLTFIFLILCTFLFSQSTTVIVVGVDGLNVIDLPKAKTPNIEYLMKHGAWTLNAKCNLPSSSSPNWASMIRGTTPDVHRFTKNGFDSDAYRSEPTCSSEPDYFPTIFTLINDQVDHPKTALIHQWPGFRRLVEGDEFDKKRNTFLSPKRVMKKGIKYFNKNATANLIFLHFDHVDHAGHKYGHGSPEYLESVEKMDKLLGKLLVEIRTLDAENSTYILLTADHGGKGHGHGGDHFEEITIPWIVYGPTIKKNHKINVPVKIEDTAYTVADILDIQPHSCWTGKAIHDAFIEE